MSYREYGKIHKGKTVLKKKICFMIYPYDYYGSEDSTDKDVIISIPKEDMPLIHEDKKRFVHRIKEPDWNATLVVIENGVIGIPPYYNPIS